jgi:hypothetical protein
MADLVFGGGMVFIVPEPKCPVHGQMREDFAGDRWICAGWDGEGCDHVARNEDLEAVRIAAGPVRITIP